jgi:hypothetical protein
MSLLSITQNISIEKEDIERIVNRIDSIWDETSITTGTAELLSDYFEKNDDFPDIELADNIEKASKEFRQDFELRHTS